MASRGPLAGACRTCLLARPLRPNLRSFSASSPRPSPPPEQTPPPPPPSPQPTTFSASAPPKGPHPSVAAAQSLLNVLKESTRTRARAFSRAVEALELERKLREMGGKINQATGYEEIELLRVDVASREKALRQARESSMVLKTAYLDAVALRASSQKEVNDLLQRKSTWSSPDVMRFTNLVQQDHENEQREAKAKAAMDAGDESVEKGFSDLMQAILERYHEEQIWSDKIRSLSTYGSLAITGLNVLLFVTTLLLIEPWKRKRLVEGVESRLRENTNTTAQATVASLSSLQTLLTATQEKLDHLSHAILTPASAPVSSVVDDDEETTETQGSEDPTVLPYSEGDPSPAAEGSLVVTRTQREKELWLVGGAGAAVGVGVSLLLGVLSGGR